MLIYSGLTDRFEGVKTIYFKSPAGIEGVVLTGAKLQGNRFNIRLKGIDTKEGAKGFVGREILLPASQKIELPEDFYFIDDLIDLEVFDESGQRLGVLTRVLEMSGNDVYVVREAEKEILIPAVAEFVKEINVKKRSMVVRLWEGM